MCLSNDGYATSLEVRKIYTALADATAHKLGMIRVIDESGEDYLYPRDQFGDIKVPRDLAKALDAHRGCDRVSLSGADDRGRARR